MIANVIRKGTDLLIISGKLVRLTIVASGAGLLYWPTILAYVIFCFCS